MDCDRLLKNIFSLDMNIFLPPSHCKGRMFCHITSINYNYPGFFRQIYKIENRSWCFDFLR